LSCGTDIKSNVAIIGVEAKVVGSVDETSMYLIGVVRGRDDGAAIGDEGDVEKRRSNCERRIYLDL
jgi:hypothetical protein